MSLNDSASEGSTLDTVRCKTCLECSGNVSVWQAVSRTSACGSKGLQEALDSPVSWLSRQDQ